MNDENAHRAIGDITFIKDIIKKTSYSLASLSEIFIKLGFMLLIISVIFAAGTFFPLEALNMGKALNLKVIFLPIAAGILLVAVIIAFFVVCRSVVKKNKLSGLSRQVMLLWLYMIILNVICFIVLSGKIFYQNINHFDVIPLTFIQFITIGFCLLVVYVFAEFRLPLYLSIAYSIVGISALVLLKPLYLLNYFILPVTLIIMGFYLKYSKVG